MRLQHAFAAALLAIPIAAQTVATEHQVAKTDKVWKIEASGISG